MKAESCVDRLKPPAEPAYFSESVDKCITVLSLVPEPHDPPPYWKDPRPTN